MTLGERICVLRTARGLSQSDLAEALEVSRQSVSKWETDASVPDLDRLVGMSRLFQVSLDQLVLGETGTETPPNGEAPAEETAPHGGVDRLPMGRAPDILTRHSLAAVILLCTAGMMALLGLLLAGGWGLLLGTPFLLCGMVVLVSHRHPGLWCFWAVVLSVQLYLQVGTGISWSIILLTLRYEPAWNYTRLLMGWGMVLVDLGLLVGTAWKLRKEPWAHRIPQRVVVLTTAVCIVLERLLNRLALPGLVVKLQQLGGYLLAMLLYVGQEVLLLVLLTVLAVALTRWLYRRRAQTA